MGIETPDYIPSIPTFKNELKSNYETASLTFEKAFKNVEADPSLAVGLTNSALESIIKEILKDSRINVTWMYAYFVINATTSVGLFLLNFYKSNYPPAIKSEEISDDELPL